MSPAGKPVSLARLVWVAFATGLLGFGGGFAVIDQIRRRVVDARGWMCDEDFVQEVAVASALPGTMTTNVVTMVSVRLLGMRSAALVTATFLLPSAALMVVLAAVFDRIHGMRFLGALIDGMSVAVVGVVTAVAIDMRRTALKAQADWALAVGALVLLAARLLTLLEVVGVAAVIGVLLHGSEPPAPPRIEGDPSRPPPAATGLLPLIVAGAPVALSLSLFSVFAKIGIATFGGGYAMIPSIAHEVVAQRGWLDDHTFGDAIALGNVTPGPIAISATFIGYRVGGLAGALAATLGIFGPPFVLAVATARSIEAFRASRLVSGALRGVSPAVVGIIAAAAYALTRSTVHSWFGAGLAVASLAVRVAFPRSSPAVPLVLSALVSVAVRAWLGAA